MRDRILFALWWVPNALTILRGFVVAPAVAFHFYVELHYAGAQPAHEFFFWPRVIALVMVLVGIFSEFLDGYLARKYAAYGWESKFGRDLDPAADKSFALCIFAAILMHYEWYFLVVPVVASTRIIWYSIQTSSMRLSGTITAPNTTAKQKTAYLMVAKGFFIGSIAAEGTLWYGIFYILATLCTLIAMNMCTHALARYRETAAQVTAPAQ